MEQDLAEVTALGRSGVRTEPGAEPRVVVETLRRSADRLGFASPIDAATHVMRRHRELPPSDDQNPIRAYHASASRTVRTGRVRTEDVTDTTVTLVFEREVSPLSLFKVTLATRVRLESEGIAHLTDHGWSAPPTDPVHSFTGTPQELLERARIDLADKDIPLERSLLLLWGARIGSEELVGAREQRLLVAEGAAVRGREIRSLLSRVEQEANGPTEGWYAACLYRSMLENLFEGFLGEVTFSVVTAEEIDSMDRELHTALAQAEKAVPKAVPVGVPETHWWWRVPFDTVLND